MRRNGNRKFERDIKFSIRSVKFKMPRRNYRYKFREILFARDLDLEFPNEEGVEERPGERAFDVQAAVKSLVIDANSEVNDLPFLIRIYCPNDG